MRVVLVTEPGVLELNWLWLPTFIGMNNTLKKELEEKLAPLLEGKPMTEEVLDFAHQAVVGFLLERFHFPGLRDYIDALKFVG